MTVGEVEAFIAETGVDVAAVIDGGICPEFNHMTIVDCSVPENAAMVERVGTIHPHALATAIGREISTYS